MQQCFEDFKDRDVAASQKQLKVSHHVALCFMLLLTAGLLLLSSSDKLFYRIIAGKQGHQGLLSLYVISFSKESQHPILSLYFQRMSLSGSGISTSRSWTNQIELGGSNVRWTGRGIWLENQICLGSRSHFMSP